MRYLKLILAFSILVTFVFSCKKKEEPKPEPTPTPDVMYNYSGSGSRGDLIRVETDQTIKNFYTYNETLGLSISGNYTVLTDTLNGIGKISYNNSNYYAVELPEKIIATNFPSGDLNNTFTFGVSSSFDNSNRLNYFYGSYFYLHVSSQPVNGSSYNREWGIISLLQNGNIIIKKYATAGTGSMDVLLPEAYNSTLPIDTGELMGTWAVNTNNKERFNVIFNSNPYKTYTGFGYADNNQSCFVLDMGQGYGLLLGFKIQNITSYEIPGNYKYIKTFSDNYNGGKYAGAAKISTSDTCWFYNLTGNKIYKDYATSINQGTVLNNVFNASVKTNYQGIDVFEKVYFIICGQMFFSFSLRPDQNNNYVSCSAGAEL